MRMSRLSAFVVVAGTLGFVAGAFAQTKYGLGRKATDQEIAGWNIDVDRGGKWLPPGQGTVEQGRELFQTMCSACHGEKGEGGMGDRLVGGQGTLATPKPIKTVGSFWPYAPTLFDYIRRAMPLNAPQSLSSDEVYALTGYILNMNGIVPTKATMDAKSLGAVKMPNRDGFVDDPRPDVP